MWSRRIRFLGIGGAVLSALGADIVHAEIGDQLAVLFANDASLGDGFGRGVALSGSIAIVGSPGDDDNGDGSGSAYLYDIDTRKLLFKLLPLDGAPGDQFGLNVAIQGAFAVVGASGHDIVGSNSGAVYLFDTATGTQVFKLIPPDAQSGDGFGASVAIYGTTVLAGATGDDDQGNGAGSAYLFDTATGAMIRKLLPTDGAKDNHFGTSVAIDGTTALVGAPNDDNISINFGAVYIFDTATGQQRFKLVPDEAPTFGDFNFGRSVAISGTNAIMSASGFSIADGSFGAAYHYDASTGKLVNKLVATDGDSGDSFGFSVAVSGSVAIVGADTDEDNGELSGSAYLFDIFTGRQLAKVVQRVTTVSDFFGISVAISNDRGLVGAPLNDSQAIDAGAAYIFDATFTCPTDLNNDGVMDMADLGGLLGSFGSNTTPYGFADINGDGVVDTADLGVLLGAFGDACP